jgi:hypothetical protein
MKRLDTETTSTRSNPLTRWLRRLVRPRYRTHLTEGAAGGGRKLEPIADILARSGREQGAAD